MSGFAERYEKEQEDNPAEAPPKAPSRPAGKSQSADSLKGWNGLGYAELPGPMGPAVGSAAPIGAEQAALQDALRRGIRSPRQLANIIFFTKHPSRVGTPIMANEVGLIDEWRQILERIVLPALRQTFGPPNTPGAPLRVRPRRSRYY
jgi:hypothetical protein